MSTVRLDDVESELSRVVAAERFDAEDLAAIGDEVRRALAELQAADQDEKEALRKQLRKLEAQKERLIDLAADGTLAVDKLRQRLETVTLQKGLVSEKLMTTVERIQRGVEKAFAYVDLLDDPGALYQRLRDNVRRDLLAAFFKRLFVRVTDGDLDIATEQTEVNAALHESQAHHHLASARPRLPAKRREPPAIRGRLFFMAKQGYSVQRFE